MSLHPTAAALFAAGLLASAAAGAQVGVTADLGTTGAGAHLVVPMEATLNGRFGLNYLKHDFTRRSGAVDYDLKGKLQGADVLFDWYLRDNSSFHLTAGLVYNGSNFDTKAKPDSMGNFTLNGKPYSASDVGVLAGRVDFRKAAPYLGIGWGNALAPARHWNVNVDVGVFYQGTPNVQLSSSGCTTATALCGALARDVEAERARLQQDVSRYKLYPVLRASLSYQF
jgi:hypothetical protein